MGEGGLVEGVGALLPFAADFDAHLDAAVDLFGATLIVDAELENVTILRG